MLRKGDQIPQNILIIDENNKEVTLSDYLTSKYLVVYFYPKDQTPGCTEEACSFRDNNEKLKELDARVIGISSDSQKSHGKFKKKEELNFELLSDEDQKLQNAFGVWTEKSMFGKTFMGTLRTTFLVNKEGEILETWGGESENKIVTLTHAEDIVTVIKNL
ncbi:MAG: thioredoxin-dependent thiol peroxidase [Candidatus Dojkabacteria bacterium]